MKKLIIVLFVSLLIPAISFARIGVGIGTGKIVVDQVLKPGLIYSLPSFTILNTGDEPSQYAVSTTFRENQVELRPGQDWFTFEPSTFYLEPGKAQTVQVTMSLPIKDVSPGDYFVFLEGHPVTPAGEGTSVGIAAATKLYFTVEPASVFSGLYYRTASVFAANAPWSYVAILAAILIALIAIIRRYVSLDIGVSVKKRNE